MRIRFRPTSRPSSFQPLRPGVRAGWLRRVSYRRALRSSRRSSTFDGRRNSMKSLSIAVALFALAVTATAPAAAQEAHKFTPPRTPWGEPDLQGTYSNRTITPFERPANVNGREFFTKEEVAALESRAQQGGGDEGRTKGSRQDVERA